MGHSGVAAGPGRSIAMSRIAAVRAPRGAALRCRGWHQEAALRMLHNNLDPEVAENPDELIVYGGTGRAARDWPSFHAIVRALESLANDETLLVQSGRPVGVFRTHPESPRVLLANSNLVGHWSNWDEFNRLEKMGLTMYGQMTAGSWIYIGSQGIDVDPARIQRRLDTGYCDRMAGTLDEALELLAGPEAVSVALVGNCADVLPEMARRGIVPDVLTDQTSAHDPLNGYVPNGMPLAEARLLRARHPEEYVARSMAAMGAHVEAMLELRQAGAVTFDYGNNLRTQARYAGVERAFDIPGFVPEYIRPLFCEGRGPFRWVALSGDPADIYRTDQLVCRMFASSPTLTRWISLAQQKVHFQGLPARICWLGYGERARFALEMNHMVATGKLQAPIVIGRDHLDCGSVASPYRETEDMLDASDAIADWPIWNALLNTASGASWVSVHNGGGVGIGYSQHAGQVTVADGTDQSAHCLERVMTCDPGIGVLRHVDAGYQEAIDFAGHAGLRAPMRSLE